MTMEGASSRLGTQRDVQGTYVYPIFEGNVEILGIEGPSRWSTLNNRTENFGLSCHTAQGIIFLYSLILIPSIPLLAYPYADPVAT